MNPALPIGRTDLFQSETIPIESCKAAVFKVADYWLALPATAICKVIPSTALSQEEIAKGELIYWENCPLLWLDLHSLLARSATNPAVAKSSTTHQYRYVAVAWSQTGNRCAIPVDALPTLVDIPLADVQILPPHFRQSIGSLAKHTIALLHKGSVLTILLLDLQQVLNKKFYGCS
jgi:chemotaxis protein histidine kinase CheA